MGYWQPMFALLTRLGDFLSCNTECSFISSYLIRAPFKRTRNGPISLMWSFSKFLNLSWSWTAVKAAFMSKCWGWESYSRNFSWCFIISIVYTLRSSETYKYTSKISLFITSAASYHCHHHCPEKKLVSKSMVNINISASTYGLLKFARKIFKTNIY